MRGATAFRGQPVMLLLALLCGWGTLRATFWDNPFAPALDLGRVVAGVLPLEFPATAGAFTPEAEGEAATAALSYPVRLSFGDVPAMAMTTAAGETAALAPAQPAAPVVAIAGSSILFAAGLSAVQLTPEMLAQLRAAEARPFPPGTADRSPPPLPRNTRRLSADGWVLWRPDAGGPLRPGAPAYGRSQAGAVLRYSLGDTAGHRPQAHLRASTALSGAAERELAAGVSARPLAEAPLRVAAEMRVTEQGGTRELRPALFAHTEIAPIALPLDAQAEIYLQGGYVGGDFATGFADGQLRVQRPAMQLGAAELAAGLGAWGGAQNDAARLDIGPSGAVSFRLGEVNARLSADYRFRIAGDAQPADGPAITLSAGF